VHELGRVGNLEELRH